MTIDLSEKEIGLLWTVCVGQIHYPATPELGVLSSPLARKLLAALLSDALSEAGRVPNGSINAESAGA